ncbi:MAG: formylglycine-generating enzyme family protein [Planctomycetota bacterium]
MQLLKALAALLILVSLGTAAEAEDARQPVPDAAKQKEAEKLIKEVFKAEYAQTKPGDKAVLARKLSQQGDETKDDPAARYVAWKEASTLAVQGGDMDTALAVLDKIAAAFAVDVAPMKRTALTTLASSTRDPELSRTIGGLRTLLDAPDDPAANLLAGKYLCFTKNDWEKGLPLLVKGADAGLKVLAWKELAQPDEGAAQMALADSWWDMAEKESAKPQKAAMRDRAKSWYEKALPSLTGLTKIKAERRISVADAGSGSGTASSGVSAASPRTLALDLGGGVKMDMVLVPAGEFMMGEKGVAEPVHPVKITKPFYIGKYHVTVAQFRAFANAAKFQTEAEKSNRGSSVKDGKWEEMKGITWRTPGFKQDDNHPVCAVSWNDAQEFCRWARKATGCHVCLPTEAQWEYAARGPKSPKYPWGDKWDGTRANHADVTWRKSDAVVQGWGSSDDVDGFAWTAPVGSYRNASWCGAFDMVGNAWQRCEDFYDDKYYQESPSADPQGPAAGEGRAVRGGSWNNGPGMCRAALRHRHDPGSRDAGVGFRVVIVSAPAKAP